MPGSKKNRRQVSSDARSDGDEGMSPSTMSPEERVSLLRQVEAQIRDGGAQQLNQLGTLLLGLTDEEDAVVFAAAKGCGRVFAHLLETNAWWRASLAQSQQPMTSQAKVFVAWINRKMATFRWTCTLLMHNGEAGVQVPCLKLLVMLARLLHQVRYEGGGDVSVPRHVINDLLLSLSYSRELNSRVLQHLKSELWCFDDVRYHSYDVFSRLLESHAKRGNHALEPETEPDAGPSHELVSQFMNEDDVSHAAVATLLQSRTSDSRFYHNVHALMTLLGTPSVQGNIAFATVPATTYPDPGFEGGKKVASLDAHKRRFSTCWLRLLNSRLPVPLYKSIIASMDTLLLPHLAKPVLLMDFLRACYDIGGSLSMLALRGLFVLISEYNLDYPDFFDKLYALLQPSVFFVKYRARFFELLDLFLSSTHLPDYLAAAFVKRLARLCLTAPPHGAIVALPIMYNVLVRHPQCVCLLHRDAEVVDWRTLEPEQCNNVVRRKMLRAAIVLKNGGSIERERTIDLDTMQPLEMEEPMDRDDMSRSTWVDEEDPFLPVPEMTRADESPEGEESQTKEQASGEGEQKKRKKKRKKKKKKKVTKEEEAEDEMTVKSEEGANAEAGDADASNVAGVDPFLMDELDPKHCHAQESSLWELEVLRHHGYPAIARFVNIFRQALAKRFYDVDDFSDQSYATIHERELSRSAKTATIAYTDVPECIIASDPCFGGWDVNA